MSDTENKSSPQPEEAKDEPMSSEEEEEMEVEPKEESKPKPDEGAAGDAGLSKTETEDGKEAPSPKKTATPKKSPKKKKEEEEDDEEEDEEEDDDEPKLGLLERPVIIESGKREKRKVERLEVSMTLTPKDKKVDVPEGSGMKLGDIPRVEFQLSRKKFDDLKPLHRIIFGRQGSSNEIKKNLRKFCGFSFIKDDKEYTKKMAVITKFTMAMLKSVCEVLDLEKSGTKDGVVARIFEFLMEPTSSGKALPQSKRKSGGDKGKKRKRGTKKKASGDEGTKKASPKKKTAKSKEEVESSENEDEDSEKSSEPEEESEEEEKSEESEEEQPKKKARKEPTPKAAKKEEKKETKKVEKKKPEKKTSPKKKVVQESDESEDDSSSDDEPLVVKPKKPPTDDELKDVIKNILDGANLEEVTMKTVCKQVYAKFPDFDLTGRKDFIKSTVKQIIR